MRPRQVALTTVLVVVGLAVVLVPAVGAVVSDAATTAGYAVQSANESADESDVEMGAQLSSFMQAQSAEANGSVDDGMWEAQFDRTGEKERAVQTRTATLERRLDRLQDRMDRLETRRANGTISPAAYQAQASRLTAEITTLQQSIEETDEAAREAGVNATRLDDLRQQAGEVSGHEVARTARNMSGPPAGVLPDQVDDDDADDDVPGLGPPDERDENETETERERPEPPEREENETEREDDDPESDVPADRRDGDDGGDAPDDDDVPADDDESPADDDDSPADGDGGPADDDDTSPDDDDVPVDDDDVPADDDDVPEDDDGTSGNVTDG